MEVEVVEFYEKKRKDKKKILSGTMHVYIPELDMDIRGIRVARKQTRWFFFPPSGTALDEETKKWIYYPLVDFVNPEKKRAFITAIRQAGIKYITEMEEKMAKEKA